MSFRLFIYYCATCGGCAAYVGWVLGRLLSGHAAVLQAGTKGMLLGMMVALSLGLIDTMLNSCLRQLAQACLRLLVAVVVGGLGGLLGGMVGQVLYGWSQFSIFLIFGWTITGLLIGASAGAFDFLLASLSGQNRQGARRKILNGIVGGTLGGLLGGLLFLLFKGGWTSVFHNKPADELWSPSATGFVALGMCIGLLIGLAQVILKEAWVRVEAGFRAGRELILSKPQITIGRAETCDIGLFGDAAIERTHARILCQDGRYLLDDAGTAGGTYLNGQRISEPTPLRSGDLIQVGRNILRFGERQKRAVAG